MKFSKTINKKKFTKVNKMIFPTDFENNTAIQKLENKDKYIKKNCNMDELDKQQNLLKQVILSNGKQDFFTVFNMECNVGKTHTAIHTIPYYFEAVNKELIEPKGILIVIREMDEGNKYEELLNGLYPFCKVALAFNSGKYKSKYEDLSREYKSDLIKEVGKTPVVIITHENYLKMAIDTKWRKTFTKNRRLLIIDESIDICKTLTVEKGKLEKMISDLAEEDKERLIEICKPIQDKFRELELIDDEIDNKVFNFIVDTDRYLKLIKDFTKTVDSLYEDKEEKKKLRKELFATLKTIECIYTDTCLINKQNNKNIYYGISTINRKQQMWTLDNSIILDASASLQPQYEMNKDLYFLMNNKKVLEHSNWSIEYVYYGSTKSAKGMTNNITEEEQEEKMKRFYKGCSDIIKDLGINETFVVCTKEEHILTDEKKKKSIPFNPYEDYDCAIPVEHIQHFGNITGKNDYSDLKNVLITHTINYSETDYILKYMYFSGKRYADDTTKFKSHSSGNLGGINIFDDKELQDFKEKTIANHFYQAVCRVNREMKHKTKVIIISGYLGAILYVRDMLDCKCEQTNKYSMLKAKENKVNKERHKNSKESQIQNLFKDIVKGNIPKGIKKKILDDEKYIVEITRKEIQNFLGYDDNKFNKTINGTKDFMRDTGILYFKKKFIFVLDSPLK